MRKSNMLILTLLLAAVFILSGCGNREKDAKISLLESEVESLREKDADNTGIIKELEEALAVCEKAEARVIDKALMAVRLLKDRDMAGLSGYAHPEKGILFSPYAYIGDESLVFTAEEVSRLMDSSEVFNWGVYDGIGDPIKLDFTGYYERFVYNLDFAAPHMIGNNVVIGSGNTLNNIAERFPGSYFIEFHFTGFDPEYIGFDWGSLRIVFERFDGEWYIVAIVHDEWTI